MAVELSALPPEILDLILGNKAISYASILLWKCGDKVLNRKIALGVTFMHLEDEHRGTSSRWPKMLVSLSKLRYLSIRHGSYLMATTKDLSEQLQQLSPSLETLELHSDDASGGILNHAPDWSLSNLESFITTEYSLGTSRLINFAALFPRLTTLKLDCYLEAVDLPGLPPTLTRLQMPNYQHNGMQKPCLSLLPRSLEVWEVDRLSVTQTFDPTIASDQALNEDWKNLPPSLTDIRNIVMLNPRMLGELLPESVKTVHATADWHWRFSTAPLPECLEEVSLQALHETTFLENGTTWAGALPSRLKTLEIDEFVEFTVPIIKALPRTLETICGSMLRCDWEEMQTAVRGSKEEENKSVSRTSSAPSADIWPPTLTDLQIETLPPDVNLLPPLLKALTIPKFDCNKMPLVTRIPLKITQLELAMVSQNVAYSDLVQLSAFRNLQTLLVDWDRLTIPVTLEAPPAPQLGSRMTDLSVSSWRWSWFAALPRTLVLFRCDFLFGQLNPTEAATTDIFQSLPSGLENLTLSDTKDAMPPTFAPTSFSTLPRLRSLATGSKMPFPSGILRTLSRRLISLYLYLKTFAAEDAPFLPPLLQSGWLGLEFDYNHPSLAEHWPITFIPGTSDAKWLGLKASLIGRQLEAQAISFQYPDPRVVSALNRSLMPADGSSE